MSAGLKERNRMLDAEVSKMKHVCEELAADFIKWVTDGLGIRD